MANTFLAHFLTRKKSQLGPVNAANSSPFPHWWWEAGPFLISTLECVYSAKSNWLSY